MSITNSTNYSNPTFTKANATTDQFEVGDVQNLAQAVDNHDHSAGNGLAVARITTGAIPANAVLATPSLTGQVTITGAGAKLGIGTAAPRQAFQSVGNVLFSPDDTAMGLYVQPNNTGDAQYNFAIGQNGYVAQSLSITPSTAASGTTFANTGLYVFSSGGVAVGSLPADPGAGNVSLTGSVLAAGAGANVALNLTPKGVQAAVVGDGTHAQYIKVTGPAPTAAAGAACGSSPPAPVVSAASNSVRGFITFGTGTGTAAGQVVLVTFPATLPDVPISVQVTAINGTTQQLGLYVPQSTLSTTGFNVSTFGIPATSQGNTTFGFLYQVQF